MEPANSAKAVEELRKFEETKRRKREGIVILVTVAFYGTGASALMAIGVAAGSAFGLSAALVQRNTRHWRRLLTRRSMPMWVASRGCALGNVELPGVS